MSSITLKKVRDEDDSESDSIRVTLFTDETGRPCGWFLGPVKFAPDGIEMPYLPRSERTLAAVAIVRAIEAAESVGLPLCVVDPDDLWTHAWRT